LGDVKQKDLTGTKISSLPIIMEKFSTKEDFGIMQFTEDDIVRNPLIKIIEEVFDEVAEEIAKRKK
jgi:phosphate starvation-inducible protein PhoH